MSSITGLSRLYIIADMGPHHGGFPGVSRTSVTVRRGNTRNNISLPLQLSGGFLPDLREDILSRYQGRNLQYTRYSPVPPPCSRPKSPEGWYAVSQIGGWGGGRPDRRNNGRHCQRRGRFRKLRRPRANLPCDTAAQT